MQNEMMQNADMDGVGFLLGMLWVFGFMALVLAAYIGRRTNERKEQTYGYELEVIKTLHGNSSDANHSLANFLTKVRGKGGWKAYFEGYHHNTRTYTKLVTDSSLSEGGVEIVSPPLKGVRQRRNWLSRVAGMLGGLVRVNRSCGVHLHLGLKGPDDDWDDEGVMSYQTACIIATKTSVLYTVFQSVFNSLVPSSRHHNDYSAPNRYVLAEAINHVVHNGQDQTDELWSETLYMWARDRRYFHVNCQSLSRYGTIEFRQHAGSINPVKLDAWAQLMSALVARATTITHGEMHSVLTLASREERILQLSDLAHFLGLSEKTNLIKYFSRRVDVLRGIPLKDKCTECARETCAGCIVGPQTDWDEMDYILHEDEDFAAEYYNMSATVLSVLGALWAFGPLVAGIMLLVGCGIGAIHGRGKQYSQGKTAPALWNALQARGTHAAGTVWLDDSCLKDGKARQYLYIKDSVPAVQLSPSLKREVSKTTWWQVFHTRFSTHGANTADNAHPHFSSCRQVVMVHNGVVGNYDEVWRAIKRKPTGPVDSQAVCEALAVGGIDEVIKHCVGPMSLIWADMRDPAGTLHFWTNGENPLHFGRLDNPSGDIMVASTEALWLEAAGKRAITESRRVQKTRKVQRRNNLGGHALTRSYTVTEKVFDRRGKPVMTTEQVPVNHWAAVVGKHYTISPEGKIDGVMTDNWQDTTRGTMLSWRSYASPPRKAKGNKDTCTMDDCVLVATNADMQRTFDLCDAAGGWPVFQGANGDELHGYDAVLHEGINPDGTRYRLPQYCQPWIDDIDKRELLVGDYEKQGKSWVLDEQWL